MDTLRTMRLFVRVVERGSFSGAAVDFGLSHGMASAAIKALEVRLGVELIRRTTRRMALTEAGEEYLDRARRILSEVDALDEAFAEGRGKVTGSLTLQVPAAFARLVLSPSLGDFLDRHPALTLRVISRDRLPDMIAEPIDLFVYTGPLPDSSLSLRSLGRFPILTVASPNYIARHGAPQTIEEIDRHRQIDILSATTGRVLDWRFLRDGRHVPRPGGAGLSFESSESAIAACMGGAGVLQNISYALADPIASGRLVPVLTDHIDPGPDLSLLTRRLPRPPARLRAMVAHLEQVVRQRRERDAALISPALAGRS